VFFAPIGVRKGENKGIRDVRGFNAPGHHFILAFNLDKPLI
jgi:hypothetical protein